MNLSYNDLMPYQRVGVERILAQRELYLGDDPGLGKTAQVLIALTKMPQHILDSGVVIICPASLRINWNQEWLKWCAPNCERYIMSYQQAVSDCEGKKELAGLKSRVWGVLVFDECHALKNTKSKRMKSGLLFNIWRENTDDPLHPYHYVKVEGVKAKKTIMLSGTPVLNKPSDMFPALRHLRPNDWKSKSEFEKRYCNGHENKFGRWETIGVSHGAELKAKLVDSGLMLRRLKNDVLKELPTKRRQILYVEGNVKNVRACNSLIESALNSNKLSDSLADMKWEVKSLDETITKLMGHIAQLRMELGKAKVKPFIEYILEQEDLGILPEKLVVFAHHREIIEEIVDALNKKGISSAKYYGGMNDKEKNAVVESFQKDKLRVFVGSIVSAGVGLTLTASSDCIILEPSYVPAENIQAEDRLHRIGATKPVLIQYITLANSLDARILGIVVEKMDIILQIMS